MKTSKHDSLVSFAPFSWAIYAFCLFLLLTISHAPVTYALIVSTFCEVELHIRLSGAFYTSAAFDANVIVNTLRVWILDVLSVSMRSFVKCMQAALFVVSCAFRLVDICTHVETMNTLSAPWYPLWSTGTLDIGRAFYKSVPLSCRLASVCLHSSRMDMYQVISNRDPMSDVVRLRFVPCHCPLVSVCIY